MSLAATFLFSLVAVLLIAAAAAIMLTDRRRQLRKLLALRTERDKARAAAAAAIRTLRLAAIELRAPATTLLGHADRLRADGIGAEPVATISAIAGQVLDLADDLQHHALADASGRVLRDEPTGLTVLLQDAVAAAQASLGPSRRSWRLPPDIAEVELIADRRAVAQILARVLGSAVRYSRHDDWIEISLDVTDERFALIVADEGTGVAAVEGAGVPGRPDSRGLGLGLALARVLMEAHGGGLTIEVAQSVGTRVTLDFPITRLVRPALASAVA